MKIRNYSKNKMFRNKSKNSCHCYLDEIIHIYSIFNVYYTKPPSGRSWYNDTCIFGILAENQFYIRKIGPIYNFIQNNYILYENT